MILRSCLFINIYEQLKFIKQTKRASNLIDTYILNAAKKLHITHEVMFMISVMISASLLCRYIQPNTHCWHICYNINTPNDKQTNQSKNGLNDNNPILDINLACQVIIRKK